MSSHSDRIRRTAGRAFHYESLRPGQEEAIASVLDGHDTLVVMPTGSGKSAIYQIPALLLDGPTVIVSPLIALQRDQSETLRQQDLGGAAVVNSLLSQAKQEQAIEDATEGATEFLFLAPEQFSNPERLAAVKAARPSLFVVDEAHCISEWGHSFRPDYLRLGAVVEELGHPVILALTATANEAVRREIAGRLGMISPNIYVHGFDRPNIWLGVETLGSEMKKRALLFERILKTRGPGIVYASTRKHAEEINNELNSAGVTAAFYHGGMNKKDREAMQDDFMQDRVEVIVATSAFGMGVDKPNVRFVFHYEPPDSLDSYYQEIGRAGRDGEPSIAVLYFRPEDLRLHKFFKGGGQLQLTDVESVLDALSAGQSAEDTLREQTGLSRTKLSRALNRLEEVHAIEINAEGLARVTAESAALPELAAQAARSQSDRHEAELDRIEQVRLYSESLTCRRSAILRYFGEEAPPECGHCDNCQGTGTERARLIADTKTRAAHQVHLVPSSSPHEGRPPDSPTNR